MKKIIFSLAAFVLFCSHDMFLKMDTYFLSPNTPASINLYNGTFDLSENTIDRNSMNDVSLIGNGTRTMLDTIQWSEKDNVTILSFQSGEAGTWVAGVSTNPNDIALTAEEFNEYLEHDGVLDMLDWRKENNAMEEDAVEKYSKHVKTIFQVGDKKTDDWQTILGYPIEFVPTSNPYDLQAGDNLQVQLLRKGQSLPNQIVYFGSNLHSHDAEHNHEDEADHSHQHNTTQLRTNDNGIVTIEIANEGHQYLRTIHMEQSNEAGLTHESNWATLTFEIGHEHSHADGHTHADGHSHGIPFYIYWVGGLALLLGLFIWLRRGK